jgi:hypothetical protein
MSHIWVTIWATSYPICHHMSHDPNFEPPNFTWRMSHCTLLWAPSCAWFINRIFRQISSDSLAYESLHFYNDSWITSPLMNSQVSMIHELIYLTLASICLKTLMSRHLSWLWAAKCAMTHESPTNIPRLMRFYCYILKRLRLSGEVFISHNRGWHVDTSTE